jgi:hypothetical protein
MLDSSTAGSGQFPAQATALTPAHLGLNLKADGYP